MTNIIFNQQGIPLL